VHHLQKAIRQSRLYDLLLLSCRELTCGDCIKEIEVTYRSLYGRGFGSDPEYDSSDDEDGCYSDLPLHLCKRCLPEALGDEDDQE
jgi:hypothetical protein